MDLNDPDVESAATKIQAGFRGHKTRKELKQKREGQEPENEDHLASRKDLESDFDLDDPGLDQAATKIQAGFRGHRTRKALKERDQDDKETVGAVSEFDFDVDDPDVEKAATKIQAGFRGHKARKEYKDRKQNNEDLPEESHPEDVDDSNTEQELAAMKIQACYRGHKTRKVLKNMSTEMGNTLSEKEDLNEDSDIDVDLNDAEADRAATKIQAGFRGQKARKETKKMKELKVTLLQEEEEEEGSSKLDDNEASIAETKIQAGYRGHKTRKELTKDKNEMNNGDLDISTYDAESEHAATKIQAGFRGHKTRKEIKDRKALLDEDKDIQSGDNYGEDAQQAATKIQAGFRGNKVRKEFKSTKAAIIDESNDHEIEETENGSETYGEDAEEAATKIQAGFRGCRARKEVQMKREANRLDGNEVHEEALDINLEDPEVEKAATKIQAGFRGQRTRKDLKKNMEVNNESNNEDLVPEIIDIDIDMDDPDVDKAATKIQAGFRGHKARKNLKIKMENNEDNVINIEEEPIDIDLEDPDVGIAATKIQAGFRGHKTRKELKNRQNSAKSKNLNVESLLEEDFITDINMEDPDVEKAATKIQAGFRGLQTRKQLKNEKAVKENLELEDPSDDQENNQDEIDIDLEDPDVEMAATKIQAGFRGLQTRKQLKNEKAEKDNLEIKDQSEQGHDQDDLDIDLEDPDVENAATKIQAGFRGHQTRKNLKNEKAGTETIVLESPSEQIHYQDEIDIDMEDPDVEKAATKIQAGFRGLQTRKQLKNEKAEKENLEIENPMEHENNQDDIDIDMEDPDVEKAATKIQAGFRGLQTRKQLKNDKEEKENLKLEDQCKLENEQENDQDEINIDMDDPDVEKAATKIQAGFRGLKTRKQLKNEKTGKENLELENQNEQNNYQDEIDIDMEDPDVEKAATKIQAGFRGLQTRKQLKNEKADKENLEIENPMVHENNQDEIDIDMEDPDVEKAATKIQAGFRGLQTRKQLKNEKEEKENLKLEDQCELENAQVEIDIDMDDPDVEKAATKIQAGFRGHKARCELRKQNDNEN